MSAEAPPRDGVRSLLAEATGTEPRDLTFRHLPGGASRQTWLVETDRGSWVLRRDPPGADSFLPLEREFRVAGVAAGAGVPVPRPLVFEPSGGRLGSAGYLMDKIGGTSVARKILRDDSYEAARECLPAQIAQALARIHSIDADSVAGFHGPSSNPALDACDLWGRTLVETGEPLPALEAGLRWLRLHAPPPPARTSLVHGDFRLGNFIVDSRGLAAVIDWELSHLGDPAEDIAWLCVRSWRFGNDGLPVAGVGTPDAFLAAYRAGGGTPPDPDRLRWWEAMGNVKWGVICARQAHGHLTGRRPSMEMASLGRRICEPEWDLLGLLAEVA